MEVGAVIVRELLPRKGRAEGSFTILPFEIPVGVTVAMVTLDLRAVDDPTVKVTCELTVSIADEEVSLGKSELDIPGTRYTMQHGVLMRSRFDTMGPAAPIRTHGLQVIVPQAHVVRVGGGTITWSKHVALGATLVMW